MSTHCCCRRSSRQRGEPRTRRRTHAAGAGSAGSGSSSSGKISTTAEMVPAPEPSFLPDRWSSPIHRAAHEGNLLDVKMLLSRGGSANAKTSDGDTPLISAASRGHVQIVRLLCDDRFSPQLSAADQYGDTALHRAASFPQVVEVLLANHAPMDALSRCGDTPLHAACWHGDVRCLRLLVQHRASVDSRGNRGERPLAVAARRGHVDAVRFLLERGGADIAALDARGLTALHIAAESGCATVCDCLLFYKATPTVEVRD